MVPEHKRKTPDHTVLDTPQNIGVGNKQTVVLMTTSGILLGEQ